MFVTKKCVTNVKYVSLGRMSALREHHSLRGYLRATVSASRAFAAHTIFTINFILAAATTFAMVYSCATILVSS